MEKNAGSLNNDARKRYTEKIIATHLNKMDFRTLYDALYKKKLSKRILSVLLSHASDYQYFIISSYVLTQKINKYYSPIIQHSLYKTYQYELLYKSKNKDDELIVCLLHNNLADSITYIAIINNNLSLFRCTYRNATDHEHLLNAAIISNNDIIRDTLASNGNNITEIIKDNLDLYDIINRNV